MRWLRPAGPQGEHADRAETDWEDGSSVRRTSGWIGRLNCEKGVAENVINHGLNKDDVRPAVRPNLADRLRQVALVTFEVAWGQSADPNAEHSSNFGDQKGLETVV